ncbi:hypothetical protein BLOT_000773 [Blomia tropicalis]|nr:hypothetical protein BLOT_000773 [Blomia tropicalis]
MIGIFMKIFWYKLGDIYRIFKYLNMSLKGCGNHSSNVDSRGCLRSGSTQSKGMTQGPNHKQQTGATKTANIFGKVIP